MCREGQYTMTQFWEGKLLGGYAGLEHTAKLIADYIPKCEIYVEPFAGLGRVAKEVNAKRYILNDKSKYAFDFLTKNFNAEITNVDFEETIKLYDSKDTFFLIDPPWRDEHYSRNSLTFLDKKPWEYYKKIFEMIPNLKGDWILCGVADERQTRGYMSNHNYNKLIVESKDKVIFGKKARTLLVSNKPFVKQGIFQEVLF